MTTRTRSRIDIPSHYYRTPQRVRFFDAYDRRQPAQTLLAFCIQYKHEEWCPSQPTASRWIRQRQERSKSPERRPAPSKKIGRPRIEVDQQIELLAKGPTILRRKDYPYHEAHAHCSYRTLQRRMKEREPPIIRSKRQKTSKISDTNKAKRKQYGDKYRHETVESLWQWIHWTDESHIDRAMAVDQYIFREEGNSEGLVMEEPTPGHLVLHIAASISWHHKGNLIFYNDSHWTHQHIAELWKQQKPRRNRKQKSEEQFQKELQDWTNLQPPETVERGNSMSQQYYSQQILPAYIELIHKQKDQGMPAILMEDGDPSHGHRSKSNPPAAARELAKIQLHDHPPQSPDLNPIEGLWLLLNERLKQVYGDSIHQMGYHELRHALEACWNLITLPEIRTRISDMPDRCKQIAINNGGRVRGGVW